MSRRGPVMGTLRRLTSPRVAGSRPARIFKRVDFPQPEGPTMATNSPSPTVKSIPSRASTVPRAVPYSLRRPFTWITSADRAIATPPPVLYHPAGSVPAVRTELHVTGWTNASAPWRRRSTGRPRGSSERRCRPTPSRWGGWWSSPDCSPSRGCWTPAAAARWHQDIERARDRTHERNLTPGELADAFGRAGLSDVQLAEDGFDLDFDEWFDRGTPALPKAEVRARVLAGGARGFDVRARPD